MRLFWPLVGVLALAFSGAVAQTGPAIDPARAQAVFAEAARLSDKEGGRLWGMRLYGPMFVVDPASRAVAANGPDPQGLLRRDGQVWVGSLPDSVVIANAPVEVGRPALDDADLASAGRDLHPTGHARRTVSSHPAGAPPRCSRRPQSAAGHGGRPIVAATQSGARSGRRCPRAGRRKPRRWGRRRPGLPRPSTRPVPRFSRDRAQRVESPRAWPNTPGSPPPRRTAPRRSAGPTRSPSSPIRIRTSPSCVRSPTPRARPMDFCSTSACQGGPGG